MKRSIGFSTGVLHKTVNAISPEIIKICQDLGCNAIELNCHSHPDDVAALEQILFREALLNSNFDHVSIHLPCNIRYQQHPQDPIRSVGFQSLHLAHCIAISVHALDYILVHPDLVDNWDIFDGCTTTIVIENMDNRKKSFKTLAKLRYFFQKYPQFKFVLDVQHWAVNDNPVINVPKILTEFSDRLVGVHLSGIDVNKYHAPLFKTNQPELVEALINLPKDVPIILEGDCENIEEMKKELAFVRTILER